MTVLTIAAALAAIVFAVGAAGYGERDVVDKAVASVEHAVEQSRPAVDGARRELVAARDATIDGLDGMRDRLVEAPGDLERALSEATTDARSGVADSIDALERLLDELESLVRA